MKYMLLMYGSENAYTDETRRQCMADSLKVCDELAAQGKLIATSPLHPVRTARTVRVRDGRPLVTDGPFAETTEQLGGFFLLDLENLDEAIAIASKLPPASVGTAEIRPASDLEGLPPARPLREGFGRSDLKPFMLISYDTEAAKRDCKGAGEAVAMSRELDAKGQYLIASPLHPTSTATCVRIRNGKRQITDGPFAETNEVVGGFYVVLARSQDEALQYGASHSSAGGSTVEVRELFDYTALKNPRAKW
jgi:hypothetical protein